MFGYRKMRVFENFSKRMHENTNKRLELIDNTVVETSLDNTGTAEIFAEVLQDYVNKQRLGRVMTGVGFRRSTDYQNVYMPDVAYVSYERTIPLTRESIIPYMPDLVVLVQTPDITTSEIADRSLFYLRNGTGLVWIAHPESATVDVCWRSANGQVRVYKVGMDGALMGNDLLPGLMLMVEDIFSHRQFA